MLTKNEVIIGTAAWRQNYGFVKQQYLTTKDKTYDLLDEGIRKGFKRIDTALNYGDVVDVLKNYSKINKLKIISKFKLNPQDLDNTVSEIKKNLQYFSNAKSIDLLIHNTDFLYSSKTWDRLLIKEILKKFNYVKFGISIYTPKELDLILKSDFIPSIIQIPICFGDYRWEKYISNLTTNLINKLNNIEIHARSIFLQGFLINNKSIANIKKGLMHEELKKWWDFVKKFNIKPYQMCLSEALNNELLKGVVIGANSLDEINTLYSFIQKINSSMSNNKSFMFNDEFLDIRTWKE